jgi:hypothetical protein
MVLHCTKSSLAEPVVCSGSSRAACHTAMWQEQQSKGVGGGQAGGVAAFTCLAADPEPPLLPAALLPASAPLCSFHAAVCSQGSSGARGARLPALRSNAV